MSKEKRERANLLDPTRFKIAHQNAMPNGAQNNAPDPVVQSSGEPIIGRSAYNDFSQNYMQMGSAVLNPINVGPSGLQQNFPLGQRNNAIPFGMQQQPDTSGASPATDGMEAGRQAQAAQQRGLFAGPMGMMGQPAVQGNMPENPAFSGPPMMQGMPSAEQAAGKGMNTRTGKRGK